VKIHRLVCLVVLVLLVVPGCPCDPIPPVTEPPAPACSAVVPSSTDAEAREGCPEERAREMAANAMPRNAMPRNAMPRNAMPRNALSIAALTQNRVILDKLAAGPLDDAALQALGQSLNNDEAQALVSYIASCALDPDVAVGAGVASASTVQPLFRPPWKGQLGLCGQLSRSDWHREKPSEQCLELVTACLLARTNADGKRVVISVRGEPECLFPVQSAVPVVEEYRESFGTPIASLSQKCTSATPGPIETQDCGWSPHYVGRCVHTPGGENRVTVTLKGEEARLAALRACAGIHGCDANGPPKGSRPARYSRALTSVACDSRERCEISFPCPSNGPPVGFDATKIPASPHAPSAPRYGYFSILFRGEASPAVAERTKTVDYPATEAEVFMYPEGGFFGNLFAPACEAPPGERPYVLWGEMYACYSDLWSDGLGELADRLCATTSPALCFENMPRPCGPARQGRVCEEMDPPASDGDYDICAGAGKSQQWRNPITVYLNHPCDLSDPPACHVSEAHGGALDDLLDQK
jgi:hypothetical protein